MSQEQKKVMTAQLKPILQKYGAKGTLSVKNNSGVRLKLHQGLHLRLKIGPLNPYWYMEHYKGQETELRFLNEVMEVLNRGNHDRSDIMTDYYDVGWYVYVEVMS
jgi:hypothetical protein